MNQQKFNQKMDSRCPRKLEVYPDSYCPLAVMRLRHLRNAGRELSIEEEMSAAGCNWAISNQMSCYCFFKFAHLYLDKPISDIEIAYMNSISVESVKRIDKEAVEKMRHHEVMEEIVAEFSGENVIDDILNDDVEYKIVYK